jgi:glycosyltransferase involved in cell wall biosynthesis
MRVAHVLSHVSSVHAGVPIATRKIGRLLRHYGVDVSFWTTGTVEDQRMLENDGILSHVFPRAFPRGWRYAPGLGKALRAHSDSIDVLHVHEIWTYPVFAALRAAKQKCLPFIWSPRASLEPWRLKHKKWKKHIYFSVLCRPMMEEAACMHAVSTGEADGIRTLGYRGPIAVIPNGVNPDEFMSLPDPTEADLIWQGLAEKRVVLFLSRLSPEKGIDQLLPAWKRIASRPSYQDAMLVLAGPDDRGYQQVIRSEISRLGIDNSILLTGLVSGRQKMALISRADLYVLPSYSEGFSNSLLENFAAGKPALITDGCHFPEVVEAGAALCVQPESSQLFEGLSTMLDKDSATLKEMGNRGRKLVLENYTWDVSVRKLLTLYSLILSGGTIPLYPEPAPPVQDNPTGSQSLYVESASTKA